MTDRIRHICRQHFSQKEGWIFLIAWTVFLSMIYYGFHPRQTKWDLSWWLIISWALFCIAYLTIPQWKLISIRLWLILTNVLYICIFTIVLTLVYFLFLYPVSFIKKRWFTDKKIKYTNWEESRFANQDFTSMG